MHNPVTYLEAQKALRAVSGRQKTTVRMIGSCTLDSICLFTRAAFARSGVNLAIDTIPYGTLHQHLAGVRDDTEEIAFILPWDLCGPLDWRGGVPKVDAELDLLLDNAEQTMQMLRHRCKEMIVYVDAPVFPVFRNSHDQARLSSGLRAAADAVQAVILPASFFSMAAYLTSGEPISGTHLARTGNAIFDRTRAVTERGGKKVLVTDLDNCLWHGIVGEDGPDGVSADPEGRSYRHFIYQSFLRRLSEDGIILAVASRNDPDLARSPLERSEMQLNPDDFAAIEAGYGAKSAAVRSIAATLNLGLESFVFVDDNPVELAEVESELPEVSTVLFPSDDQDLPALFSRLNGLFHRDTLTEEDRRRQEFYRNRASLAERAKSATSVDEFLRSLHMKMEINSRTPASWSRAVQLINKTNQFNLNGRRWAESDVARILDQGGRLLTAKLTDNSGEHGEIISFLIDGHSKVRAFVMSCRVFQRRVEYAFLLALSGSLPDEIEFDFAETERNTPFSMFIDDPAFSTEGGVTRCNLRDLKEGHKFASDLFTVERNDVGS